MATNYTRGNQAGKFVNKWGGKKPRHLRRAAGVKYSLLPELQVVSLAGNIISGELSLILRTKLTLQLLNLSDNALVEINFLGSVPSGFRFVQVLDPFQVE